jgi:hypothetical protein
MRFIMCVPEKQSFVVRRSSFVFRKNPLWFANVASQTNRERLTTNDLSPA